MSFVKLKCSMLDSSLWSDREAREVFITALLMARPHIVDEPAQQIQARDLKKTGWSVPPGEYGMVEASGIGILQRAGIDRTAGLAALDRLASPDSDSKDPEFEGRRLVRVDGGYLVLNYMKYRERDETSAARVARFREKKKNPGNGGNALQPSCNALPSTSTSASPSPSSSGPSKEGGAGEGVDQADALASVWHQVNGRGAIRPETVVAQMQLLLKRGAALGEIEGAIHANPGWTPMNLEKKLFPMIFVPAANPEVNGRAAHAASMGMSEIERQRKDLEEAKAKELAITPEQRKRQADDLEEARRRYGVITKETP